MRFYKIEDQIVISDKGLSVGEELTPNTSDGAFEKHLPVLRYGKKVFFIKGDGYWFKKKLLFG